MEQSSRTKTLNQSFRGAINAVLLVPDIDPAQDATEPIVDSSRAEDMIALVAVGVPVSGGGPPKWRRRGLGGGSIARHTQGAVVRRDVKEVKEKLKEQGPVG
jgi:hypothetical protein